VGRRHAELIVTESTYHLSDLGSVNGIEQIKDGKRFPFKQGYVLPDDEFSFGERIYSIAELLAMLAPAAAYGGAGNSNSDARFIAGVPKVHRGKRGSNGGGPAYRSDETISGQRIRCPGCGTVILVRVQSCPECGEKID
jgi:hypothetical protein